MVMEIVITMLDKSIEPGQNSDMYMHFYTCRNLCSVAVNVYSATSQSSYLRYSLTSPKGVYHLHKGNTHTIFLESMVKGVHEHMPIASSRNFPMTSTNIFLHFQ